MCSFRYFITHSESSLILQKKILRHRQVQQLSQVHTVSKWQGRGQNLLSLTQGTTLVISIILLFKSAFSIFVVDLQSTQINPSVVLDRSQFGMSNQSQWANVTWKVEKGHKFQVERIWDLEFQNTDYMYFLFFLRRVINFRTQNDGHIDYLQLKLFLVLYF